MTEKMGLAKNVVFDAIDELNEQLAKENRLHKATESALLGCSGKLDSLGFVNLIVLVEEKCQDVFGVALSLTDGLEREAVDPLATVGSFIDYVCRMVEEARAN